LTATLLSHLPAKIHEFMPSGLIFVDQDARSVLICFHDILQFFSL